MHHDAQQSVQVLPLLQEQRGGYAFNGNFTEAQRDAEYAGTADRLRCGYMAPSGFDIIRDYPPFQKCKVVVVNLVAKGRDVLLNMQHVAPLNAADERTCFISIMDINGAPAQGSAASHGWRKHSWVHHCRAREVLPDSSSGARRSHRLSAQCA
jgi:hypothetical protein